MAGYRCAVSSCKVYSSTNLKDAQLVGGLREGARVQGTVSGNWLHIESINDPEWQYHHGIVEGMYCSYTSAGRTLFRPDTSKSNAEIGDDEKDTETNTIYNDDSFTNIYSTAIDDNAYRTTMLEGLDIQNIRGIMGKPHQFLPYTDPRIDMSMDDNSFGRIYADKIIKPMPLLFMTPGVPSFMSSFSKKQKSTIIEQFMNKNGIKIGNFDELVTSRGGKYYSLKFSYIEYFSYVNAMLRSAAYYLGIENEDLGSGSLKNINWFYTNGGISGNDIFDNNGLNKFLGTYAGAVPFYVEAETRTSDDFSNSTTQSSLSSGIDGLSDTARELNYLIGNVAGNIGAGQLYDEFMSLGSTAIDNTSQTIENMLGHGNIISNIMTKLQTIISGGRMVFPEIWSDSSFSRSYRITVKLNSPSGDKLSIFYNILVPIYHLIAFVLPRNSTGQTFYSPFLVRAYYKGIFNIDMGIITDMSVSKGSDGEWTPDGLPTTAEVSFEIKDLYDALSMSRADDDKDKGILSNISELDYIANSCGININEPEITRTIKMAVTLGFTDNIRDKVTMNIFGNVTQYFNQKVQNIFGKF